MILPESLPRREEAILLRNNYLSHRLPRILLGIPSYSNTLDGLLIDILQELELQQAFGVVLGVEFLQPVAQDVVGAGVGLDGLFVQLPLRFGRGDQAEFCYTYLQVCKSLAMPQQNKIMPLDVYFELDHGPFEAQHPF
jgi:hypothetical protein